MRKLPGLLTLCLMIASQHVAGMDVGGIKVPDSIVLQGGDATLLLNGAGIRKKFFMNIYVGALYLPAKNPDAEAIIGDSGPASVDMHILHSEISREKITDGWEDGMQSNLGQGEMELLRPRLDQFNEMFRAVRKGDMIRIGYLPGIGTEVRINDERRGVVVGNDFFRALLRVWLGHSPVSKSLKQAMLGRD
ncbi:MAG: chalcone isomerase family protein [Gammaproteobacteria bacterium]